MLQLIFIVFSDKIIFPKLVFLKDGSKCWLSFFINKDSKKKTLVRAMHYRIISHLRDAYWRKTDFEHSVKFGMKSWKFLRNFRRIFLWNSQKFWGISRQYVSYPLNWWPSSKNFSGIFSQEIPKNYSGISQDFVFYSVLR